MNYSYMFFVKFALNIMFFIDIFFLLLTLFLRVIIKSLQILLHQFLSYYDQLTPGLEANESCFKEQIPGVTNGGERLG